MLPEEIKKEIVTRLKKLRPNKVILFGSYAYGKPHKESDIDLYVVTGDEFMPKNFEEKSEIYLKVSRALDKLYEKYPIDLIVHTKPMSERFDAIGSMFSKKIKKEGIRLL